MRSLIQQSGWWHASSKSRWNTALERVAHLEERIARHDAAAALRPKVDRAALIALARDLPTTWNARGTDARTKQRITHILIREVILDRDEVTNEAIVVIHWNGGRHTELRVSRGRTGRYPVDRHPNPVEAVQELGGHWPDREVAATMNRMRCKPPDGKAWTTVRVRELRERLGIAPFDPSSRQIEARHLCRRCAGRQALCRNRLLLLNRPATTPLAARNQLNPRITSALTTTRMSALSLRRHLGGDRVQLHQPSAPHFHPRTPCGASATLSDHRSDAPALDQPGSGARPHCPPALHMRQS